MFYAYFHHFIKSAACNAILYNWNNTRDTAALREKMLRNEEKRYYVAAIVTFHFFIWMNKTLVI